MPGFYLVNASLDFKLDSKALPFFPEELSSFEFTWDFGDGGSGSGLELNHTFTTTGSKVISIYSRDTRTSDPAQLLSTLFVNVAPTTDYKLPQPVLLVNGMRTKDYLTDTVEAAFTKKVTLDASKTEPGSAPIVSFLWDLGNRQIAKDSKVTTSYDNLFSNALPVVRITDKNGLFIDADVQINNTTLPDANGKIPATSHTSGNGVSPWHKWLMAGVATLALVGLGFGAMLLHRRTARHHTSDR